MLNIVKRPLPILLFRFFLSVGRFMRASNIVFFLIFQSLFLISCNSDAFDYSSDLKEVNKSDSKSSEILNSKLPKGFFEMKFVDLEGVERSLSEFKGKTILLNFWASWCVPCIAELPSLQKAHEELSKEGLVILAIASDSKENFIKIRELVKDKKLNFTVFLDSDLKLAEKFDVTGFPETFAISSKGELASIYDYLYGKETIRIISDRDWSSSEMLKALRDLLRK